MVEPRMTGAARVAKAHGRCVERLGGWGRPGGEGGAGDEGSRRSREGAGAVRGAAGVALGRRGSAAAGAQIYRDRPQDGEDLPMFRPGPGHTVAPTDEGN